LIEILEIFEKYEYILSKTRLYQAKSSPIKQTLQKNQMKIRKTLVRPVVGRLKSVVIYRPHQGYKEL